MFSLQKQTAKLCSFNPRSEIHGEEKVSAADLGIQIKVSNDVLSEFDPLLKSSLYAKADQGDIEPGHLPALKFPKMGAVKWAHEFVGYEIMIHYGASEKQNIVMADCKLDKIKFDCQVGGTVVMNFRVVAHPAEKDAGRLCGMIQQDLTLTLTPPDGAEELEAMGAQ